MYVTGDEIQGFLLEIVQATWFFGTRFSFEYLSNAS